MKELNATVGVYDTHDIAVKAMKELNKSGFTMRKVSIIGKELEKVEDVQGSIHGKTRQKSGWV